MVVEERELFLVVRGKINVHDSLSALHERVPCQLEQYLRK